MAAAAAAWLSAAGRRLRGPARRADSAYSTDLMMSAYSFGMLYRQVCFPAS
jgi:hypothetical protein